MIIGSGNYRYEVIDRWGKLPAGMQFGTTHGVVEDAQGRILIHHTGEKSVTIFSPEGEFLDAWGESYSEGAHGMFLNREADGEYLYLAATTQDFVAKTTLDGEEIFRITAPDRPDIYNAEEERFFIPTECTVASNGDIYIADGYGQPWIHQYTAQAEYVHSFGGPGEGIGQLNNPHGIMTDTRSGRERLLVADRGNHRLQYFTLDGKPDGLVDRDLRMPCTAITQGGDIYIPDLFSRLSIFDKDDQLVAHLGDWPQAWEIEGWPNLPEEQWREGYFSSPHDLHVDGQGNIYVAEWLSNGVGKLTKLLRLGS